MADVKNINGSSEEKSKRPEDINSFFDENAVSGFKFKDLVCPLCYTWSPYFLL